MLWLLQFNPVILVQIGLKLPASNIGFQVIFDLLLVLLKAINLNNFFQRAINFY